MSTATLSAADVQVSDAMQAEINSIKVETGSTETVDYSPKAWTRTGRTD